jgi:hypothetical protein
MRWTYIDSYLSLLTLFITFQELALPLVKYKTKSIDRLRLSFSLSFFSLLAFTTLTVGNTNI